MWKKKNGILLENRISLFSSSILGLFSSFLINAIKVSLSIILALFKRILGSESEWDMVQTETLCKTAFLIYFNSSNFNQKSPFFKEKSLNFPFTQNFVLFSIYKAT